MVGVVLVGVVVVVAADVRVRWSVAFVCSAGCRRVLFTCATLYLWHETCRGHIPYATQRLFLYGSVGATCVPAPLTHMYLLCAPGPLATWSIRSFCTRLASRSKLLKMRPYSSLNLRPNKAILHQASTTPRVCYHRRNHRWLRLALASLSYPLIWFALGGGGGNTLLSGSAGLALQA